MIIYHIHHIIPRHMGGTDDPSNLVRLTIEEHAEAHRKLFEEHGRWQDYVAWQSLSGMITKQEIIKEACKQGGKIQGNRNKQSGHMIRISKLVDHRMLGKHSANICKEKKVNCFFNKELHRKSAKLGGKVQGEINRESGHMLKLATKNRGSKWITNGVINKRWFEPVPPEGFKFGITRSI